MLQLDPNHFLEGHWHEGKPMAQSRTEQMIHNMLLSLLKHVVLMLLGTGIQNKGPSWPSAIQRHHKWCFSSKSPHRLTSLPGLWLGNAHSRQNPANSLNVLVFTYWFPQIIVEVSLLPPADYLFVSSVCVSGMELGDFNRFSKKSVTPWIEKLQVTFYSLEDPSEEWSDILARPEIAFYCLVLKQFSRCRGLTILSSECLPDKYSVGIGQVLSLESSNPRWMCASVSLAHVWVDLDWMEGGEHISPGQSLPEDDTASRPKQVYGIPELFLLLPLLCFLAHWRRVCSITVELVFTTCAWILLLRAFSCSGTYFAIFAISWKHGRINSPTSGFPNYDCWSR